MALPDGSTLEKVAIFSEGVNAYQRQGEPQTYGFWRKRKLLMKVEMHLT